jgi:hypothetical protein
MKDKFIPASVRIETPNHKTQQHPPSPPPTKTGKKGFTNTFKTPNKTQKNPLLLQV